MHVGEEVEAKDLNDDEIREIETFLRKLARRLAARQPRLFGVIT